MKKILAVFIFVSSLAFAGTITINQNLGSSLGTVVISTGTAAATGILYDSSTFSGYVDAASPLTWNITIGSGANRLLVVGCGSGITDSVTGITAGGNAMSLSTSSYNSTSEGAAIYIATGIASGSISIAASDTLGQSKYIKCTAVSFSGVSQTSPVEVTTGTVYTSGGVISSTFTTLTNNDGLFNVVSDGNGTESIVANVGQTLKSLEGSNFFTVATSTKGAGTAGSYSMGWSGVQGPTRTIAIAIKPAP